MTGEPPPFVSRAIRATRESSSLRVTIPQVVAATLGLRAGDDLIWVVDPLSDRVHVEAVRRETPAAEPEPVPPEQV
jgi:Antidote-toxin recognition MazE, bacterial antitoxin